MVEKVFRIIRQHPFGSSSRGDLPREVIMPHISDITIFSGCITTTTRNAKDHNKSRNWKKKQLVLHAMCRNFCHNGNTEGGNKSPKGSERGKTTSMSGMLETTEIIVIYVAREGDGKTSTGPPRRMNILRVSLLDSRLHENFFR